MITMFLLQSRAGRIETRIKTCNCSNYAVSHEEMLPLRIIHLALTFPGTPIIPKGHFCAKIKTLKTFESDLIHKTYQQSTARQWSHAIDR